MATGIAWYPVSNMVIVKKQSDSGVLWCPVSHGVSAKWSFGYLGQVKIAGKFFEG